MPRHVWAKVWCDFLRHPRFRKRPDCDVRLALGLILYAKEHAADGVVRDLDADEMRGLFGIKAPTQRVQEGLEYLLRSGWLEHADEHGSLRIKDFVDRQSADSAALRVQRWREAQRNVDANESVTRPLRQANELVNGGETRIAPRVTSASTPALPEEEEEEDPISDRSSKDGESEGKDTTACESVDNAQAIPANLSQSEQLHVSQLLKAGKASEATALLASLRRDKDLRRKAGGAT